jgi:hypothetical protein
MKKGAQETTSTSSSLSPAPAGEAITTSLSERDREEIARLVEVRQEDKVLASAGSQLETIRYWELTAEVLRESARVADVVHTEHCRCDRTLRGPKYVLPDLWETRRGDRPLAGRGFREVTPEEVQEKLSDTRLFQNLARIRRLEEPIAKAERDVARLGRDAENLWKILEEVQQQLAATEAKKAAVELEAERARKPLAEMLEPLSPEWRRRALAEAARVDRDVLSTPPPVKPRVFISRPPGAPRRFIWDPLRGRSVPEDEQ